MISIIKSKEAQAGVVSGVIIVVALLILLYTIALPTSEKCKILPDLKECNETNVTSAGSAGGEETEEVMLISEQPGLIEPTNKSTEFSFGSIELFNKDVTEIPIKTIDPVGIVEKEWFYSQELKQEFTTPGEAKKIILFINVATAPKAGMARLAVLLNGKKITTIKGAGVHTIELSGSIIKKDNVLLLKSSTPLSMFQKNVFEIGAIILKQTYSLTQPNIKKTFTIPDFSSVISADLEFNADCYSEDTLKIKVNNKSVANEKICASYKYDIKNFIAEDNTIEFLSQGNFFIHDTKLKVEYHDIESPTYYFAITKEQYEDLEEGRQLANLNLFFPTTDKKQILIYVNGNPVNIPETTKTEYHTAISNLLKQGQNSLRIVPETKVNLGKIELILE